MKNVYDPISQQPNLYNNSVHNNNPNIQTNQIHNIHKLPNFPSSFIQSRQQNQSLSHCSPSSSKHLLNIALVSDFYYPFVGGVQIHIKQLAMHLNRHNKIGNIIVITHKYDHHNMLKYIGIKNTHGFRVYYLNIHYNKQYMITYPTFIFNYRAAAKILKQQKIDIVHCHQSGSTLALQFIFFAKILGIRVILTQHSLYGFRSLSDIHFNRVCQFFMMLCDRIIAVSKTTRNNIILRAKIPEGDNKVIVIPNGVRDVSHIREKRMHRLSVQNMNSIENTNGEGGRTVKIISVGRMTYRRGTDLLMEILPELCRKHEGIEVLIVGDGVKRKALQKIIQIHQLHHKVKLLGIISDHDKVLAKMSECDIFLNTPLTESFGIALAEAAMLGLCCVSTNVGGVEEAIPSQDLLLTEVQPTSLLSALQIAIHKIRQRRINNTYDDHIQTNEGNNKFQYKWQDVCERTVELYENVISRPKISRRKYIKTILKKGNFFQIFFVLLALLLGLTNMIPFLN